ncbi:hypothetical protein [Vibrio coralliilyticus]|uniref:hypothetical protein n=1 Tax=Vibrio coralliilyticus TaxID=190893 RepID=UPI0018437CAE|nr:hypothetical protein [Vibrio coralliilyticus]NUW68056.1 hypothetical protein [Vibrio coralliilyticus]
MKTFREILFDALVNELGVAPAALSRLDNSTNSALIELKAGREIFISVEENEVKISYEYDIKRKDEIIRLAPKIMQELLSGEEMLLLVENNKLTFGIRKESSAKFLEKEISKNLLKIYSILKIL